MFESVRRNKNKTFFIVFLVSAFVLAAVYFIAEITGYGELAVPLAFGITAASSFGSYYFSDKIVLKMSGARPADAETDKRLRNILEGVCVASGMPMPRLYIVNDPSPNAFATGRNPKNAVVCVTTGLLDTLDYYELEGVLAHEMAHIKNYDILLATVVAVMLGMVVMLARMFARSRMRFGGSRRSSKRDEGGNVIALVIFVVGAIFLILSPFVSKLIQMALSRNREYLADATAVEFTRNPNGLAEALRKISGSDIPVSRVSDATASMYISNPYKKKKANLFATHPPIEERINAIMNIR